MLSVKEITFLHFKELFQSSSNTGAASKQWCDFFSSSEYPGTSPNLNVCENIGRILEDCVEERTANYDGIPSLNDLRQIMIEVLGEMEVVFCYCLKSYPSRMQVMVKAGGGHTN